MVIRDGCTVFRSPVQQHDFNFTYQLESGTAGDLPSSGEVGWILFLLYFLSANGSVTIDKCIRNISILQKYNLYCKRRKLH